MLATIACDLKEFRNYKELGQPWRNRVKKQEPRGHTLAVPFKTLHRGERTLDNQLWVSWFLQQGRPVKRDAKGDTQ